jgi:PAS domain S-box-containing protein
MMNRTVLHDTIQIPEPDSREQQRRDSTLFRRITIACGTLVTFLGVLSLIGWVLQNPFLMSFSSYAGFKTVAISAGTIWFLVGVDLAVLAYRPLTGISRAFAAAISGLVLLYSLLEFILSLFGSHFFLEDLLAQMSADVSLPSTPISPVATGLIIPSAIGLLLLLYSQGDGLPRQSVRDIIGMLGVVVFVVSFTFLISYFFGTPYFYGTAIIPIAAPSALAGLIFGTGLMTAPGPETFPLRYGTGESIRARLLRTFLSLNTVIIIVVGILYSLAIQTELLTVSLTFSITLIMFLIITGLVVSVAAARTGQELDQAERKRKEAEDELRESEQKLKILADFTYDWDYWIGTDKQLLYITPSCERVTGYSSSEFYARPELMELILHPDDKDRYIAHTSTYQENSGPGEIEFRIVTKEGNTRWIGHRCQPVSDTYGNQIGRRGSNRDITGQKILEEERQALLKDLEVKNAELERFTYTVSHDLKSPLITIQGFLGYLEQDVADGNHEAVEDDIRRINGASQKMTRLLSELLKLSRIGRIMNPPEEVPFEQIAHEALEMVEGKIHENKVEILLQETFPGIYGDRTRLVEVMVNLLENAVKFMGDQEHPKIWIGSSEKEGQDVFYVRDNGIGIDPRFHEKIFDLFEKIDTKSDGTGVGLALVKRIIEVHGGKIWVESEGIGKGSSFLFTLGRITDSTPGR